MADVQLEHGYTRIANELLEALARAGLPGRHYQVMLAMARQLYGFNKAEDRISASQIAALTGLDAANVRRVLADLLRRGLLQADSKAGRITTWRIQKDHEQWSDLGRRQPRSLTTQVACDLGHVRPDTQVAGDLGTQVAGDLHQRQKDILPKTDRLPLSEASEPPKRSPLLNLLAKLDGSPREKELWLAETGPQIEVDAEATGKTERQLAIRYYRAYLRRPEREFAAKVRQEEIRTQLALHRERTQAEREASGAAAEAQLAERRPEIESAIDSVFRRIPCAR